MSTINTSVMLRRKLNKSIKRIILLALLSVFLFATGCSRQPGQAVTFNSYRDVPGITEGQAQSIERLIDQHEYFIYGMLQNDEAFYTINDEIVGFSARMCGWLTDLFGISFVPVIFDDLPDLMEALENGNAHFTGQLPRIPALETNFTMTDPISMRSIAVVQMHGSRSLSEISADRRLRFVFMEGTVIANVMENAGVFNGFEAVHVYTTEEAAELLLSGEADAFIGDGVISLAIDFPTFRIEPLFPFMFGYASFSTRDPDLFPIVEVVQKVLENGGMSVLAQLYAEGKGDANLHRMSLLLNDEEREFIANNPVIPIAAHGFSYPISFFNEWEQEFQGIALDILNEVGSITGLSFEIVRPDLPYLREVLRMLQQGEAYLAAGAFRQGAVEESFLLSSGFFRDSYTLLSLNDTPIISASEVLYMRVGLIGGSIYDTVFTEMFPNHVHTLRFSFQDDVLEALENNVVDMVFTSLRGLMRVTHLLERTEFRTNIIFDESFYVSFAINENMPLLNSIIDKSLMIVNTQAISDYWTGRTFDFTASMLRAQLPWLIGSVVLLLCVLVMSIFMFVMLRRRETAKAAMLERQQSERDTMELTQKLLDHSPMFMELWDINGNILYCSDKMTEVFNVSDKDEFMRRYYEFSAPYQSCGTPAVELNTKMIDLAMKQGTSRCEWTFLLPSGEELPTDSTWLCVLHHGNPMFISYSMDLRPIKAAMQSEESSKAKSSFLAKMSHEIRTPLSAILGISEIQLRGQAMPPHIEESFTKIYDSSKMLLNIVNDILDLSRIESGKMSLTCNEYDVASLVSDASQLHLIFSENKNVVFQIFVDKNLPAKLIGDVLRIRQIITNLLTNAFKYTDSGKVILSLQCEEFKDGFMTLAISIKDTGMGMTKEQIDELKGEYVRFHEQSRPFISGTGLGIPIVYSLIQMMDAQFDFLSVVNKGTTAIVRIPQEVSGTDVLGQDLARSLENFETATWSVAKDLEFVPENMSYGNVLVVDDVETNLYVAEAMLESFGLGVDLCESGYEAIEKVKRGKTYDIIFMDHMMPEMDGIETMQTLREMGYDRPIVALTANAVKGQAEMFIKNGFSGFMSKPIDIKILNSYLVRFIKNDQTHGE